MKAVLACVFVCVLLAAPAFAAEEHLTGTAAHEQCIANEQIEEKEEPTESTVRFGVALCLFLLGIAYFNGYLLEKYHFHYLHEAGAALLLGILVSGIIKVAGASQEIHDIVSFDVEFFFLFLLPPIIFEAGFNMKRVMTCLPCIKLSSHLKQRNFFRNIFPVCMLAFVGTFISTAAVGLMMYAIGVAGSFCFVLYV